MGVVEYLKSLFFGRKSPVKNEQQAMQQPLEQDKPIKMTPEEFEEFLRKGGNMDYTINKVENMEERIKAISEHPIQKKVIEHEILSGMLETMKDMNSKLSYLPEIGARVNSLPTMNEMYAVMEKITSGAPDSVKKDLEKIVGKVESELDEAYLLLLTAKGELTADAVAIEFKISRNTASERLNALCDLGKIKKIRRNRKVFFSLTSGAI